MVIPHRRRSPKWYEALRRRRGPDLGTGPHHYLTRRLRSAQVVAANVGFVVDTAESPAMEKAIDCPFPYLEGRPVRHPPIYRRSGAWRCPSGRRATANCVG